MTDAVLTSSIRNARAAARVLDQAEQAGLPDPMCLSVGREYDNEISRNTPQIRLQFSSADDLTAWARHLDVDVTSHTTVATSFGRVASVWHHDAIAEWMDVALALTALTEHPIRSLAVVP